MAELATIARPYARAAFMHAQGAGAFKAWGDFLDAAAVAVADERIRAAIGAPQRNKGAAAELVVSVLGAAGVAVDSGAKNFLALLGENRRLETLPAIAALRTSLTTCTYMHCEAGDGDEDDATAGLACSKAKVVSASRTAASGVESASTL